MKFRKYILLLLLHGTYITGISQQTETKNKIRFQSINLVGLLEGEKGSAFQLQTINGLQYNSWFVGVGVGLDYYRIRSVPVFADVRKNFGQGQNKFFAYIDAGLHYPWLANTQKDLYGSTYSNGFYSDIGFGYRMILHGNSALILSIGYGYKQTEETVSTTSCPFYGPCYPSPQKIDYNLNRLNLKLGLVL